MKFKMFVLDMEANGTGATGDLCKALTDVLDAVFPAEPRVEVHCADSSLSAHETKANHDG